MPDKQYFVYMLECSNGSYYTGYTTDIKRRYHEHLTGQGKCNYRRSFPPQRLAACWSMTDNSASSALKIEKLIKTLSQTAKNSLVHNPKTLVSLVLEKKQGINRKVISSIAVTSNVEHFCR